MKPFHRGKFAELPEVPRRPHVYAAASRETVRLSSQVFGDVDIHVRTWGAGPPLLLIHGLMTSSYSWRYIAEPLSKYYRVVAPDLPGAGRSSKVLDRRYSAAHYAQWILEFVQRMGLRGARAIGNSLGGYLSMQAALKDPAVFSKLVNLHSPGVPEPRLVAMNAALSIPGLRSGLAWWIRRSPLKWAHANVHYYDESLKSLEEAHEYGDPLASKEGSRAFVNILGDVLAISELKAFVAALERLKAENKPFPVPLLLIYSRQDPMVPPSIGPRLAELLSGVKLEWLEDSSHFAHVDTPEKVLPPVLEFLR